MLSSKPSTHGTAAPPRWPRRERQLWLLGLLTLAALLVGWAVHSRHEIEADEGARLAGLALALEQNLARDLEGTHAALLALRTQALAGGADSQTLAAAQMGALARAMPGVLALHWLDADGRVVAGSGVPERGSALDGAAFGALRKRPADDVLQVSPPYRTAKGVQTLDLAVVISGPRGGFGGAMVARMDPDFLRAELGSVLYTPRMQALLVHGGGGVVAANPADGVASDLNLAGAGSPFSRHRQTGLGAGVLRGELAGAAGPWLLALRTVRPASLPMGAPLVLVVGRELADLWQPWRRQTALGTALFGVLAMASWVVLLTLQRRRFEVERLAAERMAQQQAEAERLALALRGADLALWDADVKSGRSAVNDRWYTMIGLAPGEIESDDAAWQEMLHPDDRERVRATLQQHLDGHTEAFESTYRIRHRDGHWIWILDRARAVLRDAAGAPLRIVGTHMDVSERVLAEETLRRSEESLAITLMSIGDAVIATDPQGGITRINPAAERLTGWRAAEAVGQPLSAVLRIFGADTKAPALDPVARVLAQGDVVGMAGGTVLVSRDGQVHRIADSAAPIRAGDGRIVGVVLVFSDVSEQYRMLQALRDREAQLSTMAGALSGPVVRLDREDRYLFVNPVFERWFGLSADKVLGRTRRDVLGGETADLMAPHVARALRGEMVTIDHRVPVQDGVRDVMVTFVPDRDSQGTVQGCFAVVVDITERKRTEDALRLSERKSRALLESLRSGVVVHGHDGQVLEANPAACRILGLTLEQMRGREAVDPGWCFLEEDGRAMVPARYPVNQVLASGEPLRDLVVGLDRPDLDHPAWALCSAFALHDERGTLLEIVVTFSEFTARKVAEDELRLSASRLRMAGRLARLGGWRFEMPALKLWLSPEVAEMLGADPARPLTAAEAMNLVDEADRARWQACVVACMKGGAPFDEALRGRAVGGRALHLRVLGEPVRDATGRVVALQGAMQDVSAQLQAEQTLREARQELEATLAAVPDLLFDVDLDGRIHNQHSPRSELLLLAPEQFLGRRLDEVMPAEPAAVVAAALRQAHAAGYSGGLQYELPLPQGRRWFELSVARKPTPAEQRPRFIALARDVTERKQSEAQRSALERQLREAQKMESIGTLAGGIAHDFNNILAAILGNAALARDDLPAGHAAQTSLEQINKAGLRARSLVQQILTFSRRQPNELVAQDLRLVVEEAMSLLRATLPASVRLDSLLGDAAVPVLADATQLHQVLMNLCTNAWHALPDSRGLIEVGLQPLAAGAAARLGQRDMPSGACVHLWVRDTGIGMDAATRLRIFDPFFTTKAVGQGTGLGLSVVHGIVRGHGGAIAVDTVPGQGSTFHIYLPLAGPSRTPPGDSAGGGSAPGAGAGQHVVYVDDDEVMVLMVQRLLRRAGYRVTTCGDGTRALALLREQAVPPDLVITDYNMPEMSGIELALALAARWPALPVVISSGFLSDELRVQATAAGVRAMLKKENTLEELLGLVQQLLTPAAAGPVAAGPGS